MNEILFDMLEMEAREKFYINKAKKPAILICDGAWSHENNYTVYFGRGIEHWNFRSLKQAHQKILDIVKSSTIPIILHRETKFKKGVRKIW